MTTRDDMPEEIWLDPKGKEDVTRNSDGGGTKYIRVKECKCNLRAKLVGDGCEVCNPELAIRYLKENDAGKAFTKTLDKLTAVLHQQKARDHEEISALQKQNASLRARVERLREALGFYADIHNYLANMFEDKPGFNFKATPIHNEGGEKARAALQEDGDD